MAFSIVLHGLGLILCPSRHFVFYHVPKAGGNSIKSLLHKYFPGECVLYSGILGPLEERLGAAAGGPQRGDVTPLDRMHVTPAQLGERRVDFERCVLGPCSSLTRNGELHGSGDIDTGKSLDAVSVTDMHLNWRSAAIVRSPYLRVLSAFDQRSKPIYTSIWGRVPTTFEALMRWLDEGIRSRELAWCCSPTITHFLPSTHFTHWRNGSAAISNVFKTEEMLAAQRSILQLLGVDGRNATAAEHENRNKQGSQERVALCKHAHGCDASELGALLKTTPHTVETLRIVERLYRQDFDRLGYRRYNL